MIQLKTKPTDKVIELGGGANPLIRPNCDVRWCQDANGNQTVDFLADFNEPLPIQSDEWDGVFSQYALEHISWRKVKQFIREVYRILKNGGKAVFVVPNTEAQLKWIQNNPDGWDGKDAFESCSCVLFGDNDYPENTHRAYLSPSIAKELFVDFVDVKITPYGARETDMVIEAVKRQPTSTVTNLSTLANEANQVILTQQTGDLKAGTILSASVSTAPPAMSREEMFDKHYFNGGGKVGGYAREGYWDYPTHYLTAQHILKSKPGSVLEVGCARGYILKRIQDAGIVGKGIEISKHCYMTRVCDGITQWDVCNTPWPFKDDEFDLCYSVAVLEHIPEEFVPRILHEIARISRRGFHGIDFGGKDDGFDRTHFTLKPKEWWETQFKRCDVSGNDLIVDKEELEKGDYPESLFKGDGKVKLNLGSHTVQFHHGWTNVDINPLQQFAQAYRYNFVQHDLRNGLPMLGTETVDLIYSSHFLEHLTYAEGLVFLRECRRVLKPDGSMRLIVPDARLLMRSYAHANCWDVFTSDDEFGPTPIDDFDEISDTCAAAPTSAAKLWSLLHDGHQAAYDEQTLSIALKQAGFEPVWSKFRGSQCKQISAETADMFPCLSLYMDAVPVTG